MEKTIVIRKVISPKENVREECVALSARYVKRLKDKGWTNGRATISDGHTREKYHIFTK